MAGDVTRRLIDAAASLLGLVVLSPVLFAVAVTIKLDSPGTVLHRAQRIGKDGKAFRLYKFRSMVVGAHREGPAITPAGDPRITRMGRFLRRTKLDEVPQLLNVLNGDMSLVGPRPEDPRYVALYTEAQREVLKVRPGVTSPASLVYRDESALLSGEDWEQRYISEIMPRKLMLELDYLAKRNLLTDSGLVFRTLFALSCGGRPRGARELYGTSSRGPGRVERRP